MSGLPRATAAALQLPRLALLTKTFGSPQQYNNIFLVARMQTGKKANGRNHAKRRIVLIKNRTTQLIFQTVYCTLGLVGIIATVGIFDDVHTIRWDFYVHFTNISNFLCVGVVIAALIQTAKKKEDSYVSTAPMLKFISMLGILLTFLVFNLMLAGAEGRDPQANWRIGSLCFHVVLPMMYIADWFLFYERGKCKWYYPVASFTFPIGYVIFLLIQAVILRFDSTILIPTTTTPLIYPYFFVNIETQGVSGVLRWIGILSAAFVAVGFVFFGIDKLSKKKAENIEIKRY